MASSSTQSFVRPGVSGVMTKITHTCKIKHVAQILDTLNVVGGPDLVNRFRAGCFGRFLDWAHPGNLVGRLIFPFLSRELVVPEPKTAMFFSVGGQTLRYGPPEHALVTGLSFGPAPVDVCANVDIRASDFLNRVYGGMNCKADQLLGLFLNRSIGSEEDYLKAANIIIAWFVVLSYVGDRLLDPWIVILIDNLEAWNAFPWGAYSLKALMAYAGALPKTAAEIGGTISIYGPWWSFMIWVLEAVPHIAGYCGNSGPQNLMPRFMKWRFKVPNNKLDFYALLDIQMPAHACLEPTDAERGQAYWLTSIDDSPMLGNYYFPDNVARGPRTARVRRRERTGSSEPSVGTGGSGSRARTEAPSRTRSRHDVSGDETRSVRERDSMVQTIKEAVKEILDTIGCRTSRDVMHTSAGPEPIRRSDAHVLDVPESSRRSDTRRRSVDRPESSRAAGDASRSLHILKDTNPGIFTDLQVGPDQRFRYVFVALSACRVAFNTYLRPVIVVDGTHLKGRNKGVMFVAVTKDGNEQLFPLAVGIGPIENNESWNWFLQQIRRAFVTDNNLVIVSDQHPSIANAVQNVFPEAAHCICFYHLLNNLSSHGKAVANLYRKAAYAYRRSTYDKAMAKILEIKPLAHSRLMGAGPERWARSMCPSRRYSFMTSNAAESFNSRMLEARRLPICSLLEAFRHVIEHWFDERRRKAKSRVDSKVHPLTEEASKKIAPEFERSMTYQVVSTETATYKVWDGVRSWRVNLSNRSCTCGEFQLDLIPCSHAAAAIRMANVNFYDYVADCYYTLMWYEVYCGEVHELPDKDTWVVPPATLALTVHPPIIDRQAGRPRSSRIPSRVEASSSRAPKKCSICKTTGHTKRKCPNQNQ